MVLVVKNLPAKEGEKRDTGSIPESKDPLEEGMVTHCSILAWTISWTEEPDGWQSIGLQRVRHNWSNLACTILLFFFKKLFLFFVCFSLSFFFFSCMDLIRSDQSLSCVRLCNPMNRRREASLSITNSRSSLKLTSIESVMPSSHLILCRPLLLLPPIPPSIRVFSNESTLCMR